MEWEVTARNFSRRFDFNSAHFKTLPLVHR